VIALARWWPSGAPVPQQRIGELTTHEIRELSTFAVAEIEAGRADSEMLAEFLGALIAEVDERAAILAAVRPYDASNAGRR
jgi:hypothetical protein